MAKEAGNKDSEGLAYMWLGVAHRGLDNIQKAIEFFHHGLSIAKETGNEDFEETAYLNLGAAYQSLRDSKNAIEFYEQGLSIATKTGHEDLKVITYGSIGNVYGSLGDFQNAIKLFQQGLDIANKTGNKDLEGKLYESLNDAYCSLDDFQKAIEFFQQGLSIAKENGNKDSEGIAYERLGDGHLSLGNFEKGIEFFHLGRSVAKETGKIDLEGTACGKLADAYFCLNDFQNAFEFFRQALGIAKEFVNQYPEAVAYRSLCGAFESVEDYQRGIKFLQQGLTFAIKEGIKRAAFWKDFWNALHSLANLIPNVEVAAKFENIFCYDNVFRDLEVVAEFIQPFLGMKEEHRGNEDLEADYGRMLSYFFLGQVYVLFGDYQRGIESSQQGLSIAIETGNKDLEAAFHTILGRAYLALEDIQKASESSKKGLTLGKEIGDEYAQATALFSLGSTHGFLCDFQKRVEFSQQGLSIAKISGDKFVAARAYADLGNAYCSLDDYLKAVETYQEGLILAKETGDKRTQAEIYLNIGCVLVQLDDLSRGEECFNCSMTLLEEMLGLLKKDEWKVSFRDQYRVYQHLWRLQVRQGRTIEALSTAERGRAQALADLMKLQYGVKLIQSSPEEQMKRIATLSVQTSSPTIFLAEDEESVNIWVLLESGTWQFVRKEISQALTDWTNKSYKQIGVKEPVRCEDRSFGDESDDEEVEELSDRGENEKDSASSQDNSDALKILHEVIFTTISQWITNDELIIVPDGSSFLIPYAALVDQQSRYLSERLRIRLAPSLTTLSLLTQCLEEHHSKSGALLVGNPWVQTVRLEGDKFQQLPGAAKEVKTIGKMLNIEPLTGTNATKDQVLSKLHSVSLVHIAAHGCAKTGEIILSPNNVNSEKPPKEDFLLTMADVLNAKLKAKLVVLSCCHSGTGKIRAEGVVGIARAFLGAGARAVVASLWAISDEATMAFMTHFYECLMAGQSASKSLNQTMKWMREFDDFRAVRHWAPFVLIGDDVTMDFEKSR